MDITEPMPNVARLALLLPGWDKYSLWGFDSADGRMFARLWPNTDDPGMPPAIRIGPRHVRRDDAYTVGTLRADELAELIATATATSVSAVLRAMAVGAPEALQAHLLGLASAHRRSA